MVVFFLGSEMKIFFLNMSQRKSVSWQEMRSSAVGSSLKFSCFAQPENVDDNRGNHDSPCVYSVPKMRMNSMGISVIVRAAP